MNELFVGSIIFAIVLIVMPILCGIISHLIFKYQQKKIKLDPVEQELRKRITELDRKAKALGVLSISRIPWPNWPAHIDLKEVEELEYCLGEIIKYREEHK